MTGCAAQGGGRRAALVRNAQDNAVDDAPAAEWLHESYAPARGGATPSISLPKSQPSLAILLGCATILKQLKQDKFDPRREVNCKMLAEACLCRQNSILLGGR